METEQNVGHIERPKAVNTAVMLEVISMVVIGLIRSVLEFSTIAKEVAQEVSISQVILIQILSFALISFLVYMIYKGKNWARITNLVFFILGVPMSIMPLIQSLTATPISGTLGLLQVAMQTYAIILLFTKDSNAWFKKAVVVKDGNNENE